MHIEQNLNLSRHSKETMITEIHKINGMLKNKIME